MGGTDCSSGSILDSGAYANQPGIQSSTVTASALAEGANTIRICVTDTTGNTGFAIVNVTRDTTAPETQIVTHPTSTTTSTAAEFTFSGADPGGAAVAGYTCRLDGGSPVSCVSPKAFGSLPSGSHSFEVRAIDRVGNVDQTPATFQWTVSPGPSQDLTKKLNDLLRTLRIKYDEKNGIAYFLFKISGPGELSVTSPTLSARQSDGSARSNASVRSLKARRIEPRTIRLTGPGRVKLPIRLQPAGRKLLHARHKLKVRVTIRFTAADGASASKTMKITLRERPHPPKGTRG